MHNQKHAPEKPNNNCFFACNFEISDKETLHNTDIAYKIFNETPKKFHDEIKSCFKEGRASIRVATNINMFIGGNEEQRNNNIFKIMFKETPKSSKKILFGEKGMLNIEDIKELEKQGVYLVLSEAESTQQTANFKAILKNRRSYFPRTTSQKQVEKGDKQPLISSGKIEDTEETSL